MRRGPRAPSLFTVVAAATAAPLLFVRYLPFTDLPEHVAAIATMARLLPGGGGAPEYTVAFGSSQYLLYHFAGALLARLLGDAVLANRVLLAAIAIAWPFALRALLRAVGRDERVAILAPATFWNRALVIGFLPFVASVPLALFALATFVRTLDAPTRRPQLPAPTQPGRAHTGGPAQRGQADAGGPAQRRRQVLAGVLAICVFYTHVSSFVVFAATALVLALLRRRVFALVPLVPSVLAAFVWGLGGSLGARVEAGRLPGHGALDAVPLWAFDVWRSHLDEVWAALWWITFGLFAIAGLKRRPDLRGTALALAPLFCALAVYLLTPFHVGPAGYLDVRLAPMLALLLLPALALDERAPRWQTQGPIALAAVAALGTAVTALHEMRRVEHEVLGDFDALLTKMRPRTRLAMLNFEQRSPRMYFWPYVFAGSYHRLAPGTIASYSFTEIEHWSLAYAPGVETPPKHRGFWHYWPCQFELRRDGSYYDYVLVQGRRDPFHEGAPGPAFREVGRSGAFILFEKLAPEDQSPGVPDASICARIGPPPPP
ncbi:MAG: hypothetical protein KIT84_06135 [Labilithrix sp.]|nr:hypothetical protein [Labilithrix sp.]MCW5810570.1 hypothetical protein [Labilithrix sp.]